MAAGRAFDVIVIGAGVEGSATAYQLTKLAREKKVALVEQARGCMLRCIPVPNVASLSLASVPLMYVYVLACV